MSERLMVMHSWGCPYAGEPFRHPRPPGCRCLSANFALEGQPLPSPPQDAACPSCTALRSQIAEMGAILESVAVILGGDDVSDFMASFPLVRGVWDVKTERDSLRQQLAQAQQERDEALRLAASREAWCKNVLASQKELKAEMAEWRERAQAAELSVLETRRELSALTQERDALKERK